MKFEHKKNMEKWRDRVAKLDKAGITFNDIAAQSGLNKIFVRNVIKYFLDDVISGKRTMTLQTYEKIELAIKKLERKI